MNFADETLRWQRWLLAAMLFGSAVILLPPAVEPFMLPKATFLVAAGLVLAAVGAARAVWAHSARLPSSLAVWAVTAFAAALLIATATSPERWASVIGFYGRYTGLVPYLVYVLVFLVVLRVTDLGFVRLLSRTALVALGVVDAYGFLQAAGAEPFGFTDKGLGATFSSFGNVNFSSAWAGALCAVALTTALSHTEHRGWRIYAAVLLPLTVVYVYLTGTSQGLVVAVATLGWAGLLLATAPSSPVRRFVLERRALALGLAGAAAFLLAVALAVASGGLRAQLEQALVERPEFWSAAVGIFADHPVVGTGLDTYAHHFLAYRPASHALANGAATTDAPHSVPLGMFSNGGLLLGLTHLAVVILVGAALVRGAMRSEQATRAALAAWGGVWLGYQLQALISFDVPPLALLHWLSAGVIVALAAPPRWREVTLPGPKPSRAVTRKGKEYGEYSVPTSTRVLQGGIALVALVGIWFTTYPLRADLKAASAAPLAKSGQFDEAIERFDSAADLNPAEASYVFLAARGHEAARRPQQALASAREAARRDPGTVQYPLFAARQARQLGDTAQARTWYDEAVARDPRDPLVLNEAAAFLSASGDVQDARALFERTLALDPGNADARGGLDRLQATS
jgi:O-antigen ligase